MTKCSDTTMSGGRAPALCMARQDHSKRARRFTTKHVSQLTKMATEFLLLVFTEESLQLAEFGFRQDYA